MPDPGADSPDSPELAAAFPEAHQGIQAAIDYLKNEKKVERIYLMGHSMGGRMTSAFLVTKPDPAIVGFIGKGYRFGAYRSVIVPSAISAAKQTVSDSVG